MKDLAAAIWTTTSRGGHLTLTRTPTSATGGAPPPSALQFTGLRSDDLTRLRAAVSAWAAAGRGPPLTTAAQAVAGGNWGGLALEGGDLAFSALDGKPLFRLPLGDVASIAAGGRDEVSLDLPADDTGGGGGGARCDALVSIAFHVPPGAGGAATLAGVDMEAAAAAAAAAAPPKAAGSREPSPAAGPTPAAALASLLSTRTPAGASTAGTPAAVFPGVAVLAPRGRFDVALFDRALTLSGAGGEYRVPYDAIVRALLLPRPHAPHTLVAIQVDPPVRRGQTYYPILLLQFRGDDVFGEEEEGGGGGGGGAHPPTAPPLTLALPADVLAVKNAECGGRLPAVLTGPAADVFSKALRGLANTKVGRPGAFRSALDPDAAAFRASFKADDGYVYPLDRAFVYVPKPPVLVPYDDVASVEFVRRGLGAGGSAALAGAQKTFDLSVRLHARGGGGELLFRGIAKGEWTNLYDWVTARGLVVDNQPDAAAGPGGGGVGGGGGGGGRGNAQDEDSEDAEDEDFGGGDGGEPSSDDDASGDSDGGGGSSSSDDEEDGGSNKKKKASVQTKKTKAASSLGAASPPKKKAKAKKDPNAPKGALSAFMIFSTAKRPDLVAANPGAAFADIGRAAGEAWRALDADAKKDWEAKAAADKERHAREMAAYKAKAAAGAAPGEDGAAAGVKAEPSASGGDEGGGSEVVEVKDEASE